MPISQARRMVWLTAKQWAVEMELLDTFLAKHIGLFSFWSVLLALCCAELLLPSLVSRANRKKRWSTNFAIAAIQFATGTLLPISVISVALWCEAHDFGLMNHFDFAPPLQAVFTILINSFFFYVMHYLSHNVFWLWRLHSLHHSDHFVDATTSLRAHPLEQILNLAYSVLLAAVFGYSAVVLVFYYAAEAVIVVFSHSHIKLPQAVDRALSKLFVTPTIHHIHHSAHMPETNSNYGNALTLWDRMFGTFRPATIKGGPVEHYGLEDTDAEMSTRLEAQLMRPFLMRPQRRPGGNPQ